MIGWFEVSVNEQRSRFTRAQLVRRRRKTFSRLKQMLKPGRAPVLWEREHFLSRGRFSFPLNGLCSHFHHQTSFPGLRVILHVAKIPPITNERPQINTRMRLAEVPHWFFSNSAKGDEETAQHL